LTSRLNTKNEIFFFKDGEEYTALHLYATQQKMPMTTEQIAAAVAQQERIRKRLAKERDQQFANMKWDEKTAEQKEEVWKSASQHEKQIILRRISSEEDKLKYHALSMTAVRAEMHAERMCDVHYELKELYAD